MTADIGMYFRKVRGDAKSASSSVLLQHDRGQFVEHTDVDNWFLLRGNK